MGFTTGLLSGITLTTFTLYLSLAYHRQNRLSQSLTLRQSALVLQNVVEPQPLVPPPVAREVRTGLVETAKDRWNGEVESLVRRVQATDWARVGEGVVRRVKGVVGSS